MAALGMAGRAESACAHPRCAVAISALAGAPLTARNPPSPIMPPKHLRRRILDRARSWRRLPLVSAVRRPPREG